MGGNTFWSGQRTILPLQRQLNWMPTIWRDWGRLLKQKKQHWKSSASVEVVFL
jgi:hypothetical protein